jgi:hypothetical protein
MAPSLAAVVLNYRTPASTLACVRSLGLSTRPPDHVIVVDNGGECRDELAGHIGTAELIATPRNLGFGGGNNAGIRRALEKGAALVLVVNPDTTVSPDCIGLLERALLNRPGAGIAGPTVVRASAPEEIESAGIAFARWTGRMRLIDSAQPGIREVDGVQGCAMLLRAEVFAQAGFFAEDYFLYFEDLELCLRARRAGLVSIVVPEAVALHEGAKATGTQPARRLYFACRNHLRLAEQAYPLPRLGAAARAFSVVGLNLAHLLLKAPAPRVEGLRALARGTLDYLRGRYGDPG